MALDQMMEVKRPISQLNCVSILTQFSLKLIPFDKSKSAFISVITVFLKVDTQYSSSIILLQMHRTGRPRAFW